METTRDEVRVMTVHGAKGLEAPVVILADTTTPPRGAHPPMLVDLPCPPLQAHDGSAGVSQPGAPPCIAWVPRRDDAVEAVTRAREAMLDEYEHEHRRLLYVAMTRAAERLIVCGCQGRHKVNDGCWYKLIETGLRDRPGFEDVADGDARLWRYRKTAAATSAPPRPAPCPPSSLQNRGVADRPGGAQPPEPDLLDFGTSSVTSRHDAAGRDHPQTPAIIEPPVGERPLGGNGAALPPWLTTPVAATHRTALVSPSSALPEAARRRRSAAAEQAQTAAMARGTLIHRLLQSLPDIAPEHREAAAHGFLARAGAQFSASERSLFAGQVLAIIADLRFAALFAPGSRAEVSIVGRLGRGGPQFPVSGQIDRLAVTADAVLIADYKTNRDPPKTVEEALSTHWHYVAQVALYRAVLGKIYADRPVRAALVWTQSPALMELPAVKLDEALDEAAARFASK
jgi:ATP-dependent helicase/nuclease subunit A